MMIRLDRRTLMAGVVAATCASSARAEESPAAYDYLFLDLRDAEGTTPARAYAAGEGIVAVAFAAFKYIVCATGHERLLT